jgi:hypothetical protein
MDKIIPLLLFVFIVAVEALFYWSAIYNGLLPLVIIPFKQIIGVGLAIAFLAGDIVLLGKLMKGF